MLVKNILIVAPYSTLPDEGLVNRFSFLAKHLANRGWNVTFVTSTFSHSTKRFRGAQGRQHQEGLEVVLLSERGYKSHVGLRRVLSLRDFTRNLQIEFPSFSSFDIVYSAFPPIASNLYISRKTEGTRSKLVIDVQDIWPESFSAVFPFVRHIPRTFLPFSRSANKAYSSADALVSVSETYLKRARIANSACPTLISYIGSEFRTIRSCPPEPKTIKLFYLGTLSHSYDVRTIARAVHRLSLEGMSIEFHVFGGGPLLDELRRGNYSGTIFHGTVPYRELEPRIRSMHCAVNCIAGGAPQSVTNKLCDYLALGCPIMNSQTSDEVKSLLADRGHFNYRAGSVESAVIAIRSLAQSPDLIQKWVGDDRFSRESSANEITQFLETLL